MTRFTPVKLESVRSVKVAGSFRGVEVRPVNDRLKSAPYQLDYIVLGLASGSPSVW